LPEQNSSHADYRQNTPESQTSGKFPIIDSPPVAKPDLAQGYGPDYESSGLRAGLSSAADNQRDKKRQHNSAGNLLFEVAHRVCRQHLANKKNREPAGSLLYHLPEADAQVGSVKRLDTPEFLNIFARFLLNYVDNVISGNDPAHAPVVIEYGTGKQTRFGEKARYGFLIHLLGGKHERCPHDVADEGQPFRAKQVPKTGYAE